MSPNEHPEHLSRAIEDAIVGFVQADASGRITYANAQWETMLGYSREELAGRTLFDLTHPDCAEATRAAIDQLGRGARGATLVKRYLRRDGSVLHARSTVSATHDDDGRLVGFTAIVLDDSERIRADEDARRADERLHEALALGQTIVWELDLRTGAVTSSADVAEFWGVPIRDPDDFISLVHPDDREAVSRAQRMEAADDKPYEIAYRVLAPDGTIRFIQSRRRIDHDETGRPVRARGIAVDVTGARRAELTSHLLSEASDTLGASLEYEQTLANLARVLVPALADWYAVDLLNANGDLERVSVHHTDPAMIALGRQLHEQFPPRPDAASGPWHTIRTGQPSWMAELTDEMFRLGANGPEHYDLLQRLALRSFVCVPLVARGRTLGVITLAYAESGRRYGQADVDLAQRVAQRAAVAVDNAQLFRALQDADRRKNEFLAMLAHELRNPLAPVSMAADLLRAVVPGNAQATRAAEIIRRQVSHMTELVDDLLDVSRVTRGLVELQRQPVDLKTVVAAALEQAQALVEGHRHTLHTHLAADSLMVCGDRARLVQVLVNLLANAAKYTPPGGAIELTVDLDGDQVRIRVIDNGMGIDPALLPHVFELFTQAERSPDRSQGGLGIGLALVRSIVQLHEGEVRAHSAGRGAGSSFTVLLPRFMAGRTAESAPAAGAAAGRDPAQLRVLVVDDNEDAAAMVAAVLSLHGHEVRVAHSGAEARAAAAQGVFDAFVLDIGLPDTTGYALARELRAACGATPARFIALSGYGQEQDKAAARAAGFDLHLVKPADADALLASLRDGA